jgi:hypothetical protein
MNRKPSCDADLVWMRHDRFVIQPGLTETESIPTYSRSFDCGGEQSMGLILIIILLVLIFGGGGGYYAHRSYGGYGSGGILGLILIILLVVWLFGGFGAGAGYH